MGPRDPSSYTIAPAFWVVQADLFGPLTTFVPNREVNTRNSPALSANTWAMVFVCMLSKAINIQVVEGHTAVLLAQGLSRLGCEVGLPARLLIDQDSHQGCPDCNGEDGSWQPTHACHGTPNMV